jgi:hypothetical protein
VLRSEPFEAQGKLKVRPPEEKDASREMGVPGRRGLVEVGDAEWLPRSLPAGAGICDPLHGQRSSSKMKKGERRKMLATPVGMTIKKRGEKQVPRLRSP